jgi:hypothetical protein
LILFITLCSTAQTESEKKESPVSFLANAKIGFAKLSQTGNVDLNGNINGGDFIASIRLSKIYRLDTGIGLMEFDSNPIVSGNSASLTNTYLQIPIRLMGDFNIFNKGSEVNQKISLTAGLGIYANTLMKQEFQTLAGSSEERNLGWNFGLSSQIGARFILSDNFGFRLGLESQADFSKMKKDNVEQKIKNLNAFYFGMEFKF